MITILAAAAIEIAACTDEASTPGPSGEEAGLEAGDDAATDASHAPSEAAATCALPGTYGSKECMRCVAARCCDEITACEAEPACKSLQKCALDCLLGPDAGGCLNGCFATYPDGFATWDTVDRCWFGKPDGGCLLDCTN